MSKFKYLKTSNNIKLRYLTNNLKKNIYIVFLHGFMSDLEGEKPKVLSAIKSLLSLSFINTTIDEIKRIEDNELINKEKKLDNLKKKILWGV